MPIAHPPLTLTNAFLNRPPTSPVNIGGVPDRPRHGLVRDARQIDGIAQALSAAQSHGLARGWSLGSWAPGAGRRPPENHATNECRARVRVHEANRRSHDRLRVAGRHDEAQSNANSTDHQLSPWRSCKAVNVRPHEPMHLANGLLTALVERNDGTRPAYLLQQDGEGAFLLRVARLPEANVALVLTDRGDPVEPRTVLQRNPDGWRSLGDLSLLRAPVTPAAAGNGTEATSPIVSGPVDCSPYRLHAVRPEPENASVRTIIYAGRGAFVGNGDQWHRLPLSSAAIFEALLEGRRTESAGRSRTLDEVLATVRDEEILQIGGGRFYVPMRDDAGRFWLPVKKSEDEAVRVVDRRSTRCLHGTVFLRRNATREWVQQRDVPPPSRQCHANGTLIATSDDVSTERSLLGVGVEAASGYEQFRYRAVGPVRHVIEAAFEAIVRKAGRAAAALDVPANAEYALERFLRFLPGRLHASFIERIGRKVGDVRMNILLFQRSWDNLKLVNEIEGGATYCAQNGHIYVTWELAQQTPDAFARFLLSTIIGRKAGQTDLFQPLSNVDAALERAGRFVSYDATLMQSALTWPDRAHIASELTYIYETQEDRAHPMDTISFPRSDSLLSADQLDNLAILLRDNESLMSLIDALDAEWPATATPAPARLIRCPLRS